VIAALVAAGHASQAGSGQTAEAPRLIVLAVVDQFRADYVDMYSRQWSRGLKRLLDDGAVFTNAAYTYGGTVTCPGQFTIGTGTVPAVHGMVWNSWYDRDLRRSVACVTDPDVKSVPFGGGAGREAHSPRNSRALAFADELRAKAGRPAQIVSVSMKPRSAISLGGRPSPTTVVVWEEDHGVWATSSAYTATPWPDVDAFVRAHPINADFEATWSRLLPEDRYIGPDDAPGEATPGTWSRVFPHRLESKTGKPDNVFVSAWERSPFADAYVLGLATYLLDQRKLGRSAGTDLLTFSLTSLDTVGHEYGPRSHEVQDVLARVDAGLGQLFDTLDASIGRGRYVVALSSDHGVGTIPEQLTADEHSGRVSGTALRTATTQALVAALGPGTWVGSASEPNISLTAGTWERLRAVPGAVESVRAAIAGVPGIAKVYTADELASTAPTDDEVLRKWRLSYVPGRSGDFVATPLPNWIVRTSGGTTHGSPNSYDARVPLVLFGAGIRAGRYPAAASPADIAPTLARLAGFTMTQTSGRVLTEALGR
jgi:predicted AlkP superfamily pyrophosphatase or phosphodiesterase